MASPLFAGLKDFPKSPWIVSGIAGHVWSIYMYFSSILYTASNATSTLPELKEPFIPKMDDSPMIESLTAQIQPVDEFHPTVQELIEVGYSVKQSVEAVKHHEGLEEAMDYLLSLTKEGGVFQPSKSDEGHQEERGISLVTETQQETTM